MSSIEKKHQTFEAGDEPELEAPSFEEILNAIKTSHKIPEGGVTALGDLINEEYYYDEGSGFPYDSEESKKVGQELAANIKKHLDPLFDLYKDSSFDTRKTTIEFLRHAYGAFPFMNNWNSRDFIARGIKKLIREEQIPAGNYFMKLYMEKLFEEGTANVDENEPIAPGLYPDELPGVMKSIDPAISDIDLEMNLHFLMTKGVRSTLREETGVELSSLPIKYQYYLGSYLKNTTNQESEHIFDFLKEYKSNGVKTFLSLAHGDALSGEKIIELGNRLPVDVAEKIFSKYAELADITDQAAAYAEQFQKNAEMERLISEKLLMRGKNLLIDSVGKDPADILEMLETVKADAELFKATLVIEKKRGGTPSLESLRDAGFESRKPSELLPEEIASMRALYAANYAKKPELQKKLLESFDRSLENEKTVFYLFKFKDAIKGFCRFDDLGDGKKYLGSFNVDESMQGATLGESMIDQSVNVEADHCEIIADCHAANRIGARYIENGFVATDFVEDYYGIPVFSIIRNDPETAELFTTKQMNKDDLVALVSHPRNDIRIYEEESQEALLPLFGDKVGKGHVLTRYFQDEASQHWFAVLEVLRQ